MSKAPVVSNGPQAKAPTIQSVARASRILLAIASSRDGMTAKEVAGTFELTLPTAYHLLTTLALEGLLAKDQRRRYVLGPKAAVVADAVARDSAAPDPYLKLLRRLADSTGETAYLSAWRRGEIRVLATVEGAHAVRVGEIAMGYYGDAHARATGKLLLAHADPEVRDAMLKGRRLRKLTPSTITSIARLNEEFAKIRAEGVAFDREEFSEGVSCVSAPISAQGLVVAAFTLSAPVSRFDQHRDEYIATIVAIAADASAEET